MDNGLMHWYLVYTKPRQETVALQNLERQGYCCYLPRLAKERLRRGHLTVVEEPLFPRYLFIRLGTGTSAKSWAPIRSTPGISKLVTFGMEPAKVDDRLLDFLRKNEADRQSMPEKAFQPGDKVRLLEGPFVNIEGIYEMTDGNQRALVLIEFLSKPVRVPVLPSKITKVAE